jgi:hypothetical protein
VLFGLLSNLDLVAYAQSIVPDIRPQDEDTARWSLRDRIELVEFEIQF